MNTDGTIKGYPGPSSIAFCIRKWEGEYIVNKGFRIQGTASLVIDAIAIRKCLIFCKENDIQKIVVEIDSCTMVKILNDEWDVQ